MVSFSQTQKPTNLLCIGERGRKRKIESERERERERGRESEKEKVEGTASTLEEGIIMAVLILLWG